MIEIKGSKIYNRLYQTTPSVIHAQGHIDHNPLWMPLLKKVKESTQITPPPLHQDLEIITYNSTITRNDGWNYPHKTLGNAEMSLNKFAVPYTILGQNTPNWQNTLKLSLAKNFLQMSKKKYVLSMDSSDVLVIQHPNLILEFFKTQNCKMLFNAESCPFNNMTGPIPQEWENYENSLSKETFRYLNAGVWIAEVNYAIDFLDKCLQVDVPLMIQTEQISPNALYSEQTRIKCAFLNNPYVKLDYKCQVFQTILGIPYTSVKLI